MYIVLQSQRFYDIRKNSRKIQQPVKNTRAVEGLQFLLSLVEICKSFAKGIDEVCAIRSSKDIVQIRFHSEILYVKELQTSTISGKVYL